MGSDLPGVQPALLTGDVGDVGDRRCSSVGGSNLLVPALIGSRRLDAFHPQQCASLQDAAPRGRFPVASCLPPAASRARPLGVGGGKWTERGRSYPSVILLVSSVQTLWPLIPASSNCLTSILSTKPQICNKTAPKRLRVALRR